MTYVQYRTRFIQRHNALRLTAGATECGPFLRATRWPTLPPWKLFWCILYTDRKYIRLVEYFDVDSVRGNAHGTRVQFGFHYGPTSSGRDRHGCPRPIPDTEIRIDLSTDQYGAHIHYQGEDHIPQSRIDGLNISSLEPFGFIERVEDHRSTGNPLHDCFGFTVKVR
jgi:hypothetical protein